VKAVSSLYFLLLVLGALVLQATALNFVSVYGVKPDLALVLVIFNGFLRGTREGAFLGFVGGVLQDLVSGGYFGMNALAKMAAGYLAGLGEGRLYRDKRVIAAGLTWFCTLASQLVYYLLLAMVNVQVPVAAALAGIILPVSFYNALVALPLYGLYYRSATKGLLKRGEV
jgi:rod shape-determining protein MreD